MAVKPSAHPSTQCSHQERPFQAVKSQPCRKLSKQACLSGRSCTLQYETSTAKACSNLQDSQIHTAVQLQSSQFTKSLIPEIILREQFFSTETATETLKRQLLYQPKFHPPRQLNSNSQLFELNLNQRKKYAQVNFPALLVILGSGVLSKGQNKRKKLESMTKLKQNNIYTHVVVTIHLQPV